MFLPSILDVDTGSDTGKNSGTGNLDAGIRSSLGLSMDTQLHTGRATGWGEQTCQGAWEGIWRCGKHGDTGTGSQAKGVSKASRTKGDGNMWQNWGKKVRKKEKTNTKEAEWDKSRKRSSLEGRS